jgi:type IX secretion system PorP/SprF family membrane protein
MDKIFSHIFRAFMQAMIFIFVLVCGQSLRAQDLHFSLTDLAPLQLNPAMAGVSAQLHATLHSRTQWRAVPAPFNTLYASADFRFKSNSNWKLIGGIDAYNDKSGEPTLFTNALNFYAGSKIKTGTNTSLSAALSIGYRQISIRPENGMWGSQFDGTHYDQNINSGELFSTLQRSGITTGAGVVFNYSNSQGRRVIQTKKEFRFGAGAYHLNRPDNSFLTEGTDRLPIRFTAFTNGEFAIKGKKSAIMPAIYYQRQGKFQEIIIGASVKYLVRNPSQYTYFSPKFNLGWGVFYRVNDALLVKSFIEWSNFSLALAYDINSSLLRTSSHLRGALEFSLFYTID